MINVIEKYCKMSRKYCITSRAKKGQISGVYQVDTLFVTIITWHVSHINAWTRLSDAARMICGLRFLYRFLCNSFDLGEICTRTVWLESEQTMEFTANRGSPEENVFKWVTRWTEIIFMKTDLMLRPVHYQ